MKLPVLMYHDITESGNIDFITICRQQLDKQLKYIKQSGYTTISLQQLYNYLTQQQSLPSKPILLTFDDGYKSNFQLLYPLLKEYNMKATIFLAGSFLETSLNASADTGRYLHPEDIRQMDKALVDYGMHSYSHTSYVRLNLQQIQTDVDTMLQTFKTLDLNVVPLFAYPFGAYPRKDPAKMEQLQLVFQRRGIAGAFRIGNRINSLPLKKGYQIQRIDVRGNDSFFKFKRILRFGRKWIP